MLDPRPRRLLHSLTGRTALVTGATGQLGRVMARTLAACGADVVIHYHKNEIKAVELLQEIQAMGRKAISIQADITDEQSVLCDAECSFVQSFCSTYDRQPIWACYRY